MVLSWFSGAALVIAVIGCGYLIAAAILVSRRSQDQTKMPIGIAPAVTILQPLHGDEPGLLDNLSSFCNQDFPGRVQLIFGVQDAYDRAIAIVERRRKCHPRRILDLVVDTRMHGLN